VTKGQLLTPNWSQPGPTKPKTSADLARSLHATLTDLIVEARADSGWRARMPEHHAREPTKMRADVASLPQSEGRWFAGQATNIAMTSRAAERPRGL